MDKEGALHITLNNLSISESYEIESIFTDWKINDVKGEIITGKMEAHNTFEMPDTVKKEVFIQCTVENGKLKFTIPSCSVLHLEVR